MANLAWLVRRLKAMSIPEVVWRISQKMIQKSEEKKYKSHKTVVTDTLFNSKLQGINIDALKMHLNYENKDYSLKTIIPLLGGYNYSEYKRHWDAGFQTSNSWPDTFSYSLEYKQRDDIGDARTNWELNRHFQFALLAKDYRASGEKNYLTELEELFNDWNEKNPFLWGISWTSAMEIAIRCSNWCYTYCFLEGMEGTEPIQKKLKNGILNMTNYIVNHYSRYSSANNHLIVEAYAIGQSGILFDYQLWTNLAIEILTRELPLQNYSDGINKELSLHYQSFYMEAMGLMMRLMIKNGIEVPSIWNETLNKMCAYVATCIGAYGEVIEFGDNDEGKVLDIQGGLNHYQYVLGLFGFLLEKRYREEIECENLKWLFTDEEQHMLREKPLFKPEQYTCYKIGGNSILRSKDERILIGIDHAALGFGSIAAHGHADALSFQIFVDGVPVFVDPGTYIYHCNLKSRNNYRKTENHNTVCIDGKDQSEMLGAFLWGKKAECKLIDYKTQDGKAMLTASHDGYKRDIMRTFVFDGRRQITIEDEVSATDNRVAYYLFSPDFQVIKDENQITVINGKLEIHMTFTDCQDLQIKRTRYSRIYGIEEKTTAIAVTFNGNKLVTNINLG